MELKVKQSDYNLKGLDYTFIDSKGNELWISSNPYKNVDGFQIPSPNVQITLYLNSGVMVYWVPVFISSIDSGRMSINDIAISLKRSLIFKEFNTLVQKSIDSINDLFDFLGLTIDKDAMLDKYLPAQFEPLQEVHQNTYGAYTVQKKTVNGLYYFRITEHKQVIPELAIYNTKGIIVEPNKVIEYTTPTPETLKSDILPLLFGHEKPL